jgi:hypothetical protein
MTYDPTARGVSAWVPELAVLPSPELVHKAFALTAEQQRQYGVELGVTYPDASDLMLDPVGAHVGVARTQEERLGQRVRAAGVKERQRGHRRSAAGAVAEREGPADRNG